MCHFCEFLSPRYSIDKKTDATNAFKIDPNNGTIAIAKALDRETADWHNMSVEAKETSKDILLIEPRHIYFHSHSKPLVNVFQEIHN